MLIRTLTVALCLALSACASMIEAPGPSSGQLTNMVGDRFAGRPVQEMFARYGAPLRTQELAGETIYSWERSTALYFQTLPPAPVRCQLDAYVRPDATVRTVGFSGQLGACDAFAP